MSLCPCGSKEDYANCCEKYISGKEAAPTAEATMRSRYTAFAKHEIDYIFETHAEETRSDVKKEEIKTWSEDSTWLGLNILKTSGGSASDDDGIVEFVCEYEISDAVQKHHEISNFKKIDGKWFFYDSRVVQEALVRTGPKVGRNDPCPCDSGKKFKKCCGK